MRPEQWDIFKRAARREKLDKVPMALIVDSPWIPGYLGIKHLDYYLDPQLWFESNLKIMQEFPDIIMVPSWWMEYGMAAEPSVLVPARMSPFFSCTGLFLIGPRMPSGRRRAADQVVPPSVEVLNSPHQRCGLGPTL